VSGGNSAASDRAPMLLLYHGLENISISFDGGGMGDVKLPPGRDERLRGELPAIPPAISAREGRNWISADRAATF